MNSSDILRDYRHDISGKFNDISMAIKSISEDEINESASFEIFHAVHEVILKMLFTSNAMMKFHLSRDIELLLSDYGFDQNFPKIIFASITVRYDLDDVHLKYYLSPRENREDLEKIIEILDFILPIKTISREL
jgi:hypothetical protein